MSSGKTVEPWLLSDSMRSIMNIPRATVVDQKTRAAAIDVILKAFKPQVDWNKVWDTTLKNVYGVDFANLSKGIVSLFSKTYTDQYFSALIEATVGLSAQRIMIILERIKKSQDTKTAYEVKVRKFYWL